MHPPRGVIIRAVLRAAIIPTALVLLYYTVPIGDPFDGSALASVVAIVVVLVGLLVWQIRAVLESKYPGLRAADVAATVVPLFLLGFASTYLAMAQAYPGSFSEPLDKTDALYFAVTVFTTVGFGDIVAVSQPGRLVVTAQMVCGLVLVGIVFRVLLGAAQAGMRRRAEENPR